VTVLPTPGASDGVWGTQLNSFLGVAHNDDGTLNSVAVAAALGPPTIRETTGTVTLGEYTIFTGSTASQTLTLPVPSGAATNIIKNASAATVTLGPNVYQGFEGFILLNPGDSISLTWSAGIWYPLYPQQQPSQPVFNVVNFGADSTGANDSTTAIQKAINAASFGGIVYFPLGTFKISSTLVIGNATQFAAFAATGHTYSTASTTLFLASSASSWTPTSGNLSIWVSSEDDVVVPFTAISGDDITVNMSGLTSGQITALNNAVAAGTAYVAIGTISTVNNVVLRGAALNATSPVGFTDWGLPASIIKWGGADSTSAVMIEFVGPMTGGGIQNLYIDCNYEAGQAVHITALTGGVFENVFINGYTAYAWFVSGITGFPSTEESSYGILGNTINCHWRNLGGTSYVTGGNDGAFMFMDGDAGGNAINSANFTYSTITNVDISLGDPSSGGRNVGFYHRFCDNIGISNVNMIIPSGAVGTIDACVYDFSVASNCPESCGLDYVNPGLTNGTWQGFGSPSGGDPNMISRVKGGQTAPSSLDGFPVKWLSDTVNGNYT
jgi:hypothetical protein